VDLLEFGLTAAKAKYHLEVGTRAYSVKSVGRHSFNTQIVKTNRITVSVCPFKHETKVYNEVHR